MHKLEDTTLNNINLHLKKWETYWDDSKKAIRFKNSHLSPLVATKYIVLVKTCKWVVVWIESQMENEFPVQPSCDCAHLQWRFESTQSTVVDAGPIPLQLLFMDMLLGSLLEVKVKGILMFWLYVSSISMKSGLGDIG